MALDTDLKVLLENVLDAVVVMGRDGCILGWNAVAEQSFGWSAEEAIGRSLGELIVPPALQQRHKEGLERYNRAGTSHVLNQRLKLSAMRKNGDEVPIELTISFVRTPSGEAFVGFLRDISDQDLAERQARQLALESRLMFELAALAAESPTLDEAFHAALDAICQLTSWPVGHAYLVSDDGERLTSRSWRRADNEVARDLVETTERMHLAIGEGLPGRILKSGQPLWVERTSVEPNFPRKGLGFEGAFGFPVLSHGKCIAVFEFFAREPSPPDLHVLQLVQSLGAQVGRVFDHRLTEERRQVLMGELAHRTKNLISVIQGIAQQTFGEVQLENVEDALRLFTGRLAAIAAAQTALFDIDLESMSLEDLIYRSVKGCGMDSKRIAISGPTIRLSPSASLMMSLAIHELCTNSLKYGSLSKQKGIVSIIWQTSQTGAPRFNLRWEERGGPIVGPSTNKGFGSKILKRVIESETGGVADLHFLPEGLVYELTEAGHL